jgi:hypothetical protein
MKLVESSSTKSCNGISIELPRTELGSRMKFITIEEASYSPELSVHEINLHHGELKYSDGSVMPKGYTERVIWTRSHLPSYYFNYLHTGHIFLPSGGVVCDEGGLASLSKLTELAFVRIENTFSSFLPPEQISGGMNTPNEHEMFSHSSVEVFKYVELVQNRNNTVYSELVLPLLGQLNEGYPNLKRIIHKEGQLFERKILINQQILLENPILYCGAIIIRDDVFQQIRHMIDMRYISIHEYTI